MYTWLLTTDQYLIFFRYWEVMERTIASNPTQAALGGDPSAANRVRAFLAVRFYRNGQWDVRLEVTFNYSLSGRLLTIRRRSASQREAHVGSTVLSSEDRACRRSSRGSTEE